jgi:hypothetical protein
MTQSIDDNSEKFYRNGPWEKPSPRVNVIKTFFLHQAAFPLKNVVGKTVDYATPGGSAITNRREP